MLLAYQEFYTVLIIITDIRLQHINVAVLTAQSQYQNTACIGMIDQVCQNLTGMLLIVAHLRTTVRMRECDNLFHTAFNECIGLLCDGCCHVVDTANGGDDPDLVTNAYFTVGTVEAHEGHIFRLLLLYGSGIVGVLQQISQSGLNIMSMDPAALCDVLLGITDTVTIFDDLTALGNVTDCHLMSCGDLLSGGNGLRTVTDRDCDLLTGRNRI